MIWAIDFDGTIVDLAYPEIGKPNTKLIYRLKQLKEKGHKLILWTCREGKDLEEAVDFCNSVNLFFDAINQNLPGITYAWEGRKVFADVYLDDKNISIKEFLDG